MEIFRKINQNYEVSNLGRVKSLPRNTANGRILKPGIVNGYQTVLLYENGYRKQYTIHRLVAKAYIPNPENKPAINHKNGNKSDNRVENLEWVTSKENKQHSIHILGKNNVGENHSMAKLTESQVKEIRNKYVPRKYTTYQLAEEYKITRTNISDIIKRKIWKHV